MSQIQCRLGFDCGRWNDNIIFGGDILEGRWNSIIIFGGAILEGRWNDNIIFGGDILEGSVSLWPTDIYMSLSLSLSCSITITSYFSLHDYSESNSV